MLLYVIQEKEDTHSRLYLQLILKKSLVYDSAYKILFYSQHGYTNQT